MIVNEIRLAELRAAWSKYPGYEPNGFKETLDTVEALWTVAHAAKTYRYLAHTHGPELTARMNLEAALAAVFPPATESAS